MVFDFGFCRYKKRIWRAENYSKRYTKIIRFYYFYNTMTIKIDEVYRNIICEYCSTIIDKKPKY